jgi:hypothetical protein
VREAEKSPPLKAVARERLVEDTAEWRRLTVCSSDL